ELADAFDEMTRVGGNPYWREKLDIALHYLHDNKRDPNGHYGVVWGGTAVQTAVLPSWDLNDQASVAQAYLNTSINPEPGGALLCAAVLTGVTFRRVRSGSRRRCHAEVLRSICTTRRWVPDPSRSTAQDDSFLAT